MQTLLMVAAVLAVVTGIVHSVLGEILIFRHVRGDGVVPAMGAGPLRARNIRILWATWHLATVFGMALAGVLFALALRPGGSVRGIAAAAAVFAYLGGGLLVLVGTRGRHPGWIALLLVAALAWIATR